MRPRFHLRVAAFIAVSMALAMPCTAAAPTAKYTMTLAQGSRSIGFLPIYLASAKGFFASEGVAFNPVYMQGGNPTVSAVISGDAQLGAASYSVILPAVQKGQPLVAVCNLQAADTVLVVVSKAFAEKHPFSAKTPLDDRLRLLKGLKLGITSPGSGADLTARLLLRKVGLNPDSDVTLVPLQATPTAMVAALKAGIVDAVFFDSITAAEAEHDGVGVVMVNANAGEVPEERGLLYLLLFAEKSYAASHKDEIVAVDRAIYRALTFIHQHPDQVAPAIAQFYPTIPPDVLKRAVDLVLAGFPATPVITPQSQQVANNYFKLARGDVVNVPFDQIVDNQFARAAIGQP